MLIKNMDYKVYHPGNNFYDALLSQNQFFQQTLAESRESRKNGNGSMKTLTTLRPNTSTSSNMKINLSPESIFQGSSRTNLSSTRTASRQNKSLSNIPERNVSFWIIFLINLNRKSLMN